MSNNLYGNGQSNGDMFNDRAGNNINGGGLYGGMAANGLNRQPSRQFEHSRQQYGGASAYGEDDRFSNYDSRPADRSASQNYGHAQYNGTFDPPQAIWGTQSPHQNYSQTAPRMGGGRAPQRRGQIPSVNLPKMTAPLNVTDFGQQWGPAESSMSQHAMTQQNHSMPPPPPPMSTNSGYSGGQSNPMSYGNLPEDEEIDSEELIPTAIVIKNIPFAIKREQLAALMTELGLPAPYAFNYHFDSGVFRGLAFANFQNPHDTATVINAMNHMELQGRKLRVEYKKMLPQQERERIEREKRLRRGQLEEQHRPMGEQPARSLNMQTSYSSLSSPHIPGPSQSPSPVSHRGNGLAHPLESSNGAEFKLDFNDPFTQHQNEEILVFKLDKDRHMHIINPPLSDQQRRIVHELAQIKGLYHETIMAEVGKTVQISKSNPKELMMNANQYNGTNTAAPGAQPNGYGRTLGRAATTENFMETSRENDFRSLRNQASGLLVPQDSSMYAQSLRGAKSFGDLQNRGPSPSNSQGFPSILGDNANYVRNLYANPNSSASNLAGQFGSMNLGNGLNSSSISRLETSASRLGAVGSSNAGAIGSHRSNNNLNSAHDDHQSRTVTSRQPIGPSSDWNSRQGFTRNRQRGSNDLDAESNDSLESPVSGGPTGSARYASATTIRN